MSTAIYENVTRTIVEALERGVVPWKKPWHTNGELPANAITNRVYRGVNLFVLSIHPYADHRWLTFKQAIQLGGRVKASERASTVVFWKRWRPDAPDEPEEQSKRREVPLLRYYRVFNVQQCEGLELPELYRPDPPKEHERIERAEVLTRSMPNPPIIQEGGSAAWYRPIDDVVNVPKLETFNSADGYYATLFHELGHATGNEKRLNRPGVTETVQFGSGEYSKEEVVAELTSAFCCATVSLDNSLMEDAASYIQGWLKVLRSDAKAVVIAAAQAQRAADYIKGVTFQA